MNMKSNMMTMRNLKIALLALVFAGAGVAMADRQAELQERFKQRDAQVQQLKKAGNVGETFEGYIDAVQSADGATRKVIDEENADRRELYGLIAEKEGTTSSKVAERAAKRNFQRAAPGEMLKHEDGWRKKP